MAITSWFGYGRVDPDTLVVRTQEAITEALVAQGVELPDELMASAAVLHRPMQGEYVVEIRWRVRGADGRAEPRMLRGLSPDITRRLERVTDSLYHTNISVETLYNGDEYRIAEILYRAARTAVGFVAGDLYAIQAERRSGRDTGLLNIGTRPVTITQQDREEYDNMETNASMLLPGTTGTHRARLLSEMNATAPRVGVTASDAVAAFSYAIQALHQTKAAPQEEQSNKQAVVRGKRRIIINRG